MINSGSWHGGCTHWPAHAPRAAGIFPSKTCLIPILQDQIAYGENTCSRSDDKRERAVQPGGGVGGGEGRKHNSFPGGGAGVQ